MFELLGRFSKERFKDQLKNYFSKLSNYNEKMNLLIKQYIKTQKINIFSVKRELSIMSYKETLKRGYAVIRKEKNLITNSSEIEKNDILEIEFFKDKTNVKKI